MNEAIKVLETAVAKIHGIADAAPMDKVTIMAELIAAVRDLSEAGMNLPDIASQARPENRRAMNAFYDTFTVLKNFLPKSGRISKMKEMGKSLYRYHVGCGYEKLLYFVGCGYEAGSDVVECHDYGYVVCREPREGDDPKRISKVTKSEFDEVTGWRNYIVLRPGMTWNGQEV